MKKAGKHCSHKSDFPSSQNKDVLNFEKLNFTTEKKKKKRYTTKTERNPIKTHDMEETVAAELYQNNV